MSMTPKRSLGRWFHEGYPQVETEEEADLVLYNTCSIRDKAEQKVFHRLNDYKKYQKEGKVFGVLGCVAQQEGEKIFERAPLRLHRVGSASYRNLPQMLVQIEAGKRAFTGLDDRQTDESFDTEFTSRTNPHRGYITIIEGCDKFCAYCVVPYTRGKERSRTSDSVLAEARRWPIWAIPKSSYSARTSIPTTIRQGRNHSPNCWPRSAKSRASAASALPPRTRATSLVTSSMLSIPYPPSAITSICRCKAARPGSSMPCTRVHPRASTSSALHG